MQRQFTELSQLDCSAVRQANHWQQRYAAILSLAKQVEEKPQLRQAAYLLPGCSAKLWLDTYANQDRFWFCIDSESRILKGVFALILQQWQGQPAALIKTFQLDEFFQQLGLEAHLSPSRSNGIKQAIKSVQARL